MGFLFFLIETRRLCKRYRVNEGHGPSPSHRLSVLQPVACCKSIGWQCASTHCTSNNNGPMRSLWQVHWLVCWWQWTNAKPCSASLLQVHWMDQCRARSVSCTPIGLVIPLGLILARASPKKLFVGRRYRKSRGQWLVMLFRTQG